jgi:hypothetical protein
MHVNTRIEIFCTDVHEDAKVTIWIRINLRSVRSNKRVAVLQSSFTPSWHVLIKHKHKLIYMVFQEE